MPRYYYYYYGGIDRSKGRINRPLDLWTDSIKFWLTRLLLPMITDRNIYIYILLSVDRYIVWQFYHGMYIYIYIYLLHPIFPVFIEFRSRFRIEFTEPPYRATLFFLPLFILSESLNPSSSLAFEVSSEKNRSLFPRSSESKGTRIYPITFQIRYNFEEGGRGAQRVEWKSEGILLPSVFTANTY